MSADRQTICPKCKKAGEDKLASAYGTMPEAEYLALVKKSKDGYYNFSEYYKVGVNSDGTFGVNYSGYCNVCNFKYEYKTRINVSID